MDDADSGKKNKSSKENAVGMKKSDKRNSAPLNQVVQDENANKDKQPSNDGNQKGKRAKSAPLPEPETKTQQTSSQQGKSSQQDKSSKRKGNEAMTEPSNANKKAKHQDAGSNRQSMKPVITDGSQKPSDSHMEAAHGSMGKGKQPSANEKATTSKKAQEQPSDEPPKQTAVKGKAGPAADSKGKQQAAAKDKKRSGASVQASQQQPDDIGKNGSPIFCTFAMNMQIIGMDMLRNVCRLIVTIQSAYHAAIMATLRALITMVACSMQAPRTRKPSLHLLPKGVAILARMLTTL